MKFRVTIAGCLSSGSGSIDDAARNAVAIAMGELNKLGARNAAFDLTCATGAITITCAVDAPDQLAAVQPASDNIRLALGHGGIGTPDWPDTKAADWRVEFIGSPAVELIEA